MAAAVDGLRKRGATLCTCIRIEGTNLCVNAVNAGRNGWPGYSEAASRRAAAGGRRLLPVLDSGDIDGRLWIAYHMGSATSLADHGSPRLLPTATSLRVLTDVARALDEAAAGGVFASELPPDSVFLTGKGARLGDLGTAREGLAGAKIRLEGDPAYVPPEVLRGTRAGERSGVYLLGALLHYLLTGTAPQPGRPAPREDRQPDLPASIKAVVATAMAEDPDDRPHSVTEAHEMARRALRGEPPARPRRRPGTKTRATKDVIPKAATRKQAASKAGTAKRAILTAAARAHAASKAATNKRTTTKAALAERTASKASIAKRATTEAARNAASKASIAKRSILTAAFAKRTASKVAAAKRVTRKVNAATRVTRKLGAATLPARWRVAAPQVTPRRALAVGGALTLGAAAGLLLGTSPDPQPARAQTVTAGGLSVTVPSGRHRVGSSGRGLAVRTPGSLLRARVVDRRLPPRLDARPVQLGALQAWRDSAGDVVRYSIPTSQGTLAVSCRTTASGSSRRLRLCERTASTLRLRDATALPLAAAADESRRLRTAIETLRAERDAARARLGTASTPSDQHLAAEDLAESHERAAAALRELTGAAPIVDAARGAADAYAGLAASAESGSSERWAEASEEVRRSEAVLTEAIAAVG